jgi:hypothetical protein
MSDQDASHNEMPRFARQAGLSQEHEALALDMLLDGLPMPPEAPPELSALPAMLADLCGPAEASELAGETSTVTRFRCHVSPAGISPAPAGRSRPGWRLAVSRSRVAAVVAVVAVGLGGTAAAYAGVLPPPVQAWAHEMFDAPANGPASRAHATPSSPQRADTATQHSGLARQDGGAGHHAAVKPPPPPAPGKTAHATKPTHPGKLDHPGKLGRPGKKDHQVSRVLPGGSILPGKFQHHRHTGGKPGRGKTSPHRGHHLVKLILPGQVAKPGPTSHGGRPGHDHGTSQGN